VISTFCVVSLIFALPFYAECFSRCTPILRLGKNRFLIHVIALGKNRFLIHVIAPVRINLRGQLGEISAALTAVGISGFEDGAQGALPIDWHDVAS